MTPSSSIEEDVSALAGGLAKPGTIFRSLEAARSIVLAVSGGPDSTALMHLAARWASMRPNPQIAVATVDHGLGPESRDIADGVVRAATALGLDARILVWTGPKPRRAIQERARAARYALLDAFARDHGASHLVTAHTLDDQAETILFRLSRGTGLTGLRGMASESNRDGLIHARPFLGIRKADLVAVCHAEGWPVIDDPANHNPAFARTRWRRLLPLLAAEGLTPERIGRLAVRAARSEEALARAAEAAKATASRPFASHGRCYAMAMLADEPEEIVIRIIGTSLVALTGQSRLRLQRVEALVADLLRQHRQGRPLGRTLHGCRIALGQDGRLVLTPEAPRRGAIKSTQPASPVPSDADFGG